LEKNGLKLIILFEKLFGLESLAKIYQTDNSKEQQGIQAMHNSQQFIFNREKKHKTKFNNLGKNMKKYRNCSFMTICSTLSQHHPEMHTFLISPRNAHFLNITQKWLSPPFLLRLVSIDQCKSNTLN
jgi:hypothetical protein